MFAAVRAKYKLPPMLECPNPRAQDRSAPGACAKAARKTGRRRDHSAKEDAVNDRPCESRPPEGSCCSGYEDIWSEDCSLLD